MRLVAAAGRGVGKGSMTRAQHRKWLQMLDQLNPDVAGLTEQWRPGYLYNLYSVLPPLGWRVAVQKWPYGGGGVGLFWDIHWGTGPERGGFRLHGLVKRARRIVSGFRALRWVVLPIEGHEVACAVFHITPHPSYGGAVGRAWNLGIGRVKAWARTMRSRGLHVAILCDSNVDAEKMKAHFNKQTFGASVRIISDGVCHIVLIGRWAVTDTGVLNGTPSDHRPVWADARPL